jgi:hypothetical protein
MKLSRIFGLVAAALLLAPFAFADGGAIVQMEFTGVNGANDGQYYVSPYYGAINPGTSSAQNVVLFCDDIKNEVNFGETWMANITNLGTALNTTNGFANTRYGSVTGSAVLSNPGVAYEEAAWLVSQFATHTNDLVNLQYALWDIMNPGTYSNSDVSNWLSLAAGNYSSINPYGFEIITNVGPLSLTGQVQEFIVQTPEPSTLGLMLVGALALALMAISRARA